MKVSLFIVTIVLVHLGTSQGSYHGPRRPGRDRPRPIKQRHHRHIQPHLPPPPPSTRMYGWHPPGPPGRRRASRPPPPQFRHLPMMQSHNNHNQKGSLVLQQVVPNSLAHMEPPRRPHPMAPPPFFKQDEIIQEQTRHYPVTARVPLTPSYTPTPRQLIQQASHHHPQRLPPRPDSPPPPPPHHGHGQPSRLAPSAYKGWKPMIKPYQNAYLGPVNPHLMKSNSGKNIDFGGIPMGNHIHPTTMQYSTPKWNLDTLFRENTDHMKSNGIRPAFSENQNVRVPPPGHQQVKPIKSIEIPVWNNHMQNPSQQQTEQSQRPSYPPSKKPFGGQHTLTKTQIQSDGASSEESDGGKPQKVKFRPRPRPTGTQKDTPQSTPSVLPPFPHKKNPSPQQESQSDQQPLNLKAKLTTRGRVRVRGKPKVEKAPSQSEEEQSSPPSSTPKSQSPQSFPSQRFPSESDSDHYPPRRNPPPFSFGPPRPDHPFDQESVEEGARPPFVRQNVKQETSSNHPNKIEESTSQRPTFNRGLIRHHNRVPTNANERPASSDGPQGPTESTESGTPPYQQQQRGKMKKRPKDGNKHANSEVHQPSKPQPPPVNFPHHNPEQQSFLDEPAYYPPDFQSGDIKAPGPGRHPVSFVNMPGGRPQVIHHNFQTHNPHQHHHQPHFPMEVMKAPHEFRRPFENNNGPTGPPHYMPKFRPHFDDSPPYKPHNYHHHHPPPPQHHPHRFPSKMHNAPPPVFTSNSNHEPSYFPNRFSSGTFSSAGFGEPPLPMPTSSPPAMKFHTPPSSLPPPPQNHHHPRHVSSSTTGRYPQYHSSTTPFATSSYSSTVDMRASSGDASSYTPRSVPFPSSTSRSAYSTPPDRPPPGDTSPNYPPFTSNYGSAEYDKIPFQFMDQLRPILKDEKSSGSDNIHQSSLIHPPASFFDNFFQPFEQSFNPIPDQELDSKPLFPSASQNVNVEAYTFEDKYNAEQSSPQPFFVALPPDDSYSSKRKSPVSSSNKSQSSPKPQTGVSPGKGSEMAPTANGEPTWSRLQENDVDTSSTEFTPLTSTSSHSQYKQKSKDASPSNQRNGQQKTKKRIMEPSVMEEQENPEELTEVSIDKIPVVTTYKPSPDLTAAEKPADDAEAELDSSHQVMEYANPSASPPPPSASVGEEEVDEEDAVEANTPKPVVPVFLGKERRHKTITTTTTTTESPEITTYKSRRHFRRRRPDVGVRRRFFSSRVKSTTSPKSTDTPNYTSKTVTTAPEEDNPIEENEERYESSRLSNFKQRRLAQQQRRKTLTPSTPHSQRIKSDGDEDTASSPSTTMSSSESDSVTYGESQWFRIKPSDISNELEPSTVREAKDDTTEEAVVEEKKSRTKGGKDIDYTPPRFVPLDSSSESPSTTSSAEPAGVVTSYSSKSSVSYVDGKERRRFPVHRRKVAST